MRRFIFVIAVIAMLGVVQDAAAGFVPVSKDAMLSACWESTPAERAIDVFLEGASGDLAVLLVSLEPPASGELPDFFLKIPMHLDEYGAAHFGTALVMDRTLPRDVPLWLTAAFETEAGLVRTEPAALMLGGVSEEVLDFNWAPIGEEGRELRAGEVVNHQWASAGVQVWTENRFDGHPDKAILFDSANPTGDDFDLATPGYGPDNLVPEGMLLIIAENDFDANADGLVDDPDDEAAGGVITFHFDEPVVVCSVKLIDLDQPANEVRFYDFERERQCIPFVAKGDNSSTRLEMFAYETHRVQVDFGGSGGIAYLGVMPCPSRVNFDASTFGVPTNLRSGEVLTTQLDTLGVTFDAANNTAGMPDKAILFDTRHPTGGDTDLVTPGYGDGNLLPRRHVLIVADNDVDLDGDGLVDDPGDAMFGGVIGIDFTTDRWIGEATVMDIEFPEHSWIELFDASLNPIGFFPIVPPMGDNSVQVVPLGVNGVRRFELHLSGSGALVDLRFCPEQTLR